AGYEVLNEGEAEGKILGGNLGTLALLFGTSYMPELEGTILLLEDDEEIEPHHFDRTLQSLLHQPGFEGVRGIVFGRFQRASNMDLDILEEIVGAKPELDNIPIVANASFGHTTPAFTFPIGGAGSLCAHGGHVEIRVQTH
ncbi:MAG: LD-carboxypeptidase, partial [Gemmatimonadota bacterium]|nr:LD-carboxypeptidase [Gemmatimonadota bacterium]